MLLTRLLALPPRHRLAVLQLLSAGGEKAAEDLWRGLDGPGHPDWVEIPAATGAAALVPRVPPDGLAAD